MGTECSLYADASRGAEKVLRDCLCMEPGYELGIIWDETAESVRQVLTEAANKAQVRVRDIKVSLEEQRTYGLVPDRELSLEIRDVLQDSQCILNCVSGHTEGGRFRQKLISGGADRGKRLGHIPGATLELLAYAVNIDYDVVVQRCQDLALALTIGAQAELTTYAVDADGNTTGEPHKLVLNLDGLERSPITSTGVIAMDTWGNLPGGETFIAPIEGDGDGVYALNGAFKGYVFKPPEHLLLRFKKGRLEGVEGNGAARKTFEAILDYARGKGDLHYDALAELGIGVNTGIAELTGNALFDEKCAGTIHIAIGANESFGGQHRSVIHEDLVSIKPSLRIDGKEIVDAGRFVLNAEQWHETLDGPATAPSGKQLLKRTNIHGETGRDRTLMVRRDVASGRICQYTVGSTGTSQVLHQIYGLVPRLPGMIRFEDLAAKTGQTQGVTSRAVAILMRHGLITVNGHE